MMGKMVYRSVRRWGHKGAECQQSEFHFKTVLLIILHKNKEKSEEILKLKYLYIFKASWTK